VQRRPRGVTIRDFSERWLAEHAIPKLKPRTTQGYKEILARHILPALGNLTVAEIVREHVERLHLAMAKTPRTANQAHAIVHALLAFAIQHGLKASNPAAGIKPSASRSPAAANGPIPRLSASVIARQ
jgi:hypothetical protein